MSNEGQITGLPTNFSTEEKQLLSKGIKSWSSLKCLTDEEIISLVKTGLGTIKNFNRLRGIATLICEMDISLGDASLLLHAGISSVNALAILTPQELINKTGRLERQLQTGRRPFFDLVKANHLIKKARKRQILN